MSDILASSVTLEDILTVTQQKRVPMAPELAGYLTLELADAVNAGDVTDIDPRTVYVSEEGSVAIVKPKAGAQTQDVEAQLRRVLGDLLAVTGSQTNALSQVAKRKSTGAGARALATELEAALIPVNRAAGRRALARMAREARRVSLGLGRASAVPQREEPKKPDEPREPRAPRESIAEPPTLQRPRTPFPSDEAATAKRPGEGAPSATKIPVPPANRGPALAPPPRAPARKLPAPPAGEAKPVKLGPPEKLFGTDDVDSLLSSFGVTDGDASDKDMSHELKALVGLGPTPPPPGTEAAFGDDEGSPEKSDQLPTRRLDLDAKKEEPTADPPRGVLRASLKDTSKGMGPKAGNLGPPALPPPIPPPAAPPAAEGDGIEDLLAMSDENAVPPGQLTARSDLPPPLDDEPPPRPIAVATVKADVPSSAKIRAAAEAKAKEAREAKETRDARAAAVLPRAPAPPAGSKAAKAPAKPAAAAPADAKAVTDAKAPAKVPASPAVPSGREPRAPKTGLIFLVILVLVLGGGAVAVWKLAPGFFTGRTPENVKKEKDDYAAQKAAMEKAAAEQKCKASLVVTNAPAGAEVLLRMGQAPTDVERMPMKTRLEFVATAEGFAPRRAVVLPNVAWDAKKRFDLAVQLDPSKVKAPAIDPWPAGEPGADVGGAGEPGTIHVVSTPPGAEIWLLAGLGPEARIDQLKCDDGAEVLVAGSQVRKRLRMAPGDAAKMPADKTGSHVVTLSAKAEDDGGAPRPH